MKYCSFTVKKQKLPKNNLSFEILFHLRMRQNTEVKQSHLLVHGDYKINIQTLIANQNPFKF